MRKKERLTKLLHIKIEMTAECFINGKFDSLKERSASKILHSYAQNTNAKIQKALDNGNCIFSACLLSLERGNALHNDAVESYRRKVLKWIADHGQDMYFVLEREARIYSPDHHKLYGSTAIYDLGNLPVGFIDTNGAKYVPSILGSALAAPFFCIASMGSSVDKLFEHLSRFGYSRKKNVKKEDADEWIFQQPEGATVWGDDVEIQAIACIEGRVIDVWSGIEPLEGNTVPSMRSFYPLVPVRVDGKGNPLEEVQIVTHNKKEKIVVVFNGNHFDAVTFPLGDRRKFLCKGDIALSYIEADVRGVEKFETDGKKTPAKCTENRTNHINEGSIYKTPAFAQKEEESDFDWSPCGTADVSVLYMWTQFVSENLLGAGLLTECTISDNYFNGPTLSIDRIFLHQKDISHKISTFANGDVYLSSEKAWKWTIVQCAIDECLLILADVLNNVESGCTTLFQNISEELTSGMQCASQQKGNSSDEIRARELILECVRAEFSCMPALGDSYFNVQSSKHASKMYFRNSLCHLLMNSVKQVFLQIFSIEGPPGSPTRFHFAGANTIRPEGEETGKLISTYVSKLVRAMVTSVVQDVMLDKWNKTWSAIFVNSICSLYAAFISSEECRIAFSSFLIDNEKMPVWIAFLIYFAKNTNEAFVLLNKHEHNIANTWCWVIYCCFMRVVVEKTWAKFATNITTCLNKTEKTQRSQTYSPQNTSDSMLSSPQSCCTSPTSPFSSTLSESEEDNSSWFTELEEATRIAACEDYTTYNSESISSEPDSYAGLPFGYFASMCTLEKDLTSLPWEHVVEKSLEVAGKLSDVLWLCRIDDIPKIMDKAGILIAAKYSEKEPTFNANNVVQQAISCAKALVSIGDRVRTSCGTISKDDMCRNKTIGSTSNITDAIRTELNKTVIELKVNPLYFVKSPTYLKDIATATSIATHTKLQKYTVYNGTGTFRWLPRGDIYNGYSRAIFSEATPKNDDYHEERPLFSNCNVQPIVFKARICAKIPMQCAVSWLKEGALSAIKLETLILSRGMAHENMPVGTDDYKGDLVRRMERMRVQNVSITWKVFLLSERVEEQMLDPATCWVGESTLVLNAPFLPEHAGMYTCKVENINNLKEHSSTQPYFLSLSFTCVRCRSTARICGDFIDTRKIKEECELRYKITTQSKSVVIPSEDMSLRSEISEIIDLITANFAIYSKLNVNLHAMRSMLRNEYRHKPFPQILSMIQKLCEEIYVYSPYAGHEKDLFNEVKKKALQCYTEITNTIIPRYSKLLCMVLKQLPSHAHQSFQPSLYVLHDIIFTLQGSRGVIMSDILNIDLITKKSFRVEKTASTVKSLAMDRGEWSCRHHPSNRFPDPASIFGYTGVDNSGEKISRGHDLAAKKVLMQSKSQLRYNLQDVESYFYLGSRRKDLMLDYDNINLSFASEIINKFGISGFTLESIEECMLWIQRYNINILFSVETEKITQKLVWNDIKYIIFNIYISIPLYLLSSSLLSPFLSSSLSFPLSFSLSIPLFYFQPDVIELQ